MKRILATLLAVAAPIVLCAQVTISSVKVNGLDNPVGVSPTEAPVFSWLLESPAKDTYQSTYEITVSREGRRVWSSGKVNSDKSIYVPYEGPMAPDSRYEVSVKVWDNRGKGSKVAKASYHTGLRPEDWSASWIGKDPCIKPIYLKGEAKLKAKVRRAVVYVSAHGVYELSIAGKRVSEDLLAPGWTAYQKRLQYQAYDVTSMLKKGANEISALVAPGWYSGGLNYGTVESRFRYGRNVALTAQLHVTYSDGTKEVFGTDGSWKVSDGPVCDATIYDGETIDMTKAFDWKEVAVLDYKENLIETVNEPVRERKVFKPIEVIVTPKGEKVIDFGQNLVGWERVKLDGPKGTEVTIQHAEILDNNGNFYTENLRSAKATSKYILDGKGEYTFEPRHTFYGFRYIKVEGLEGDLNPEDFEAVAISSNFEDVGSFTSSNSLVNQLQSNIYWGFHGNYVDIPTDCPQRDERLGWTGDAQVFFRTATFLGRVDNFFNKWLADIAIEQKADGAVPKIIPNTQPESTWRDGSCGWSDAIMIIPWNHYMAYGDIRVLRDNYPAMRKHVEYMIKLCRNKVYLYDYKPHHHYGDWLSYAPANDTDGSSASTSKAFLAQAFFCHGLDILASAAHELGYTEDEARYKEIFEKAKQTFMNEFVTPNGLVCSDTQTSYVIALNFNLLPEGMRSGAARRLVNNITRYKDHITTGFLGCSYICNVLTDAGYSNVAYKLLLQDTTPSWLFPVKMGATTIWERWDSLNPDGTIPENGMNSFNHYSYGSIGDWLYRSAVGIRETSPGYKTFSVTPHVGGGFGNMAASTVTPYGKISVSWTAESDKLTSLVLEVPVNTTCTLKLPGKEAMTLGSGKYTF